MSSTISQLPKVAFNVRGPIMRVLEKHMGKHPKTDIRQSSGAAETGIVASFQTDPHVWSFIASSIAVTYSFAKAYLREENPEDDVFQNSPIIF